MWAQLLPMRLEEGREDDPRRQKALVAVRQQMAAIFEGPPEFSDLSVVVERAY